MRRFGLRDDQWERIKHLLPGREGSVGVTAADNRLFVERRCCTVIVPGCRGAICRSGSVTGQRSSCGSAVGPKAVCGSGCLSIPSGQNRVGRTTIEIAAKRRRGLLPEDSASVSQCLIRAEHEAFDEPETLATQI